MPPQSYLKKLGMSVTNELHQGCKFRITNLQVILYSLYITYDQKKYKRIDFRYKRLYFRF